MHTEDSERSRLIMPPLVTSSIFPSTLTIASGNLRWLLIYFSKIMTSHQNGLVPSMNVSDKDEKKIGKGSPIDV